MARKIAVEIVGDSASLERSFQRASHSATQFDKNVTHAARGAIAGSGAFQHLGRSLAFASGGFVAFASVTEFLRSSVDAAREAATGQRSLIAQMKASSQSFAANKDFVDKASQSVAKFGFTAQDSEAALTVLERATGNIAKAVQLQGVAANIARAKNISLSQAALILGKAYDGQTTSLKRLGVEIPKGVKGMDAIRIAAQKFAGQARANTTESQRFAATLHNTEVIVGTALLPVLDKLLTHIGAWLQKMNETGRLQRDVNQAVQTGTSILNGVMAVVRPLAAAFKTLGDAVGGTANEVKILSAAFLAFKARSLLVSAGLAGIGTSAETSAAKVSGLRAALLRLGAIGAVAVGIDLVVNRNGVDKTISGFLDKHGLPGGTNRLSPQEALANLDKIRNTFGQSAAAGAEKAALAQLFSPFVKGLKGISQAAGRPGVTGLNSVPSISVPGGASGIGNGPLSASQRLQVALAANPNSISLLQQQATHDRAAIAFAQRLRDANRITNAKYVQEVSGYNNDLNSTLNTIASIQAQAASKAKSARDKVAAAYRKRLREDIPAHVGDTVSYNGPNFEVHLPGRVGGGGMFGAQSYNTPLALQVAAAKAAALNDQVGLNRAAQAAKTAAMRAIHSGKLGLEAMREAWDIVAQANSTIGTSITKTATAVSSRVLTAGLGLNRDTRKALEARMALAGAFSGHVPTSMGVLGQSVHVGTIVLPNVTDPHSFADTLGKLGRSKPVQTTGHNAGRSRALP